jgi:2-polyprenyl-3-methyl-5-hydroxy-6-metoxy-1,4-benzoquinol methylase
MRVDLLANKERAKYEAIWELKDYRKNSPAEDEVGNIIVSFRPQMHHTIVDFGCGTGRAAKRFQEMGYSVTGIDIAKNCLDQDVKLSGLPFIESCLWDLPEDLMFDYGYCIDVMEHIPESKVDLVIGNIFNCVRRGVFFVIDTNKDNFGRFINDDLHLTIHGQKWWDEKIARAREKYHINESVRCHVRCR